jgi:hypothetical protein
LRLCVSVERKSSGGVWRRGEEIERRCRGRSLEKSVLEWRSVFLVRDLEGGPGDRVSKGVVRSS